MVYRLRALGCSVALVLAGFSTGGCASLVGEQETETKFLVLPGNESAFSGWSTITVDADPSDANSVTLKSVLLDVLDPPTITDLSFLQQVAGDTLVKDGDKEGPRTRIAEKNAIPPGERLVPLEVKYRGDLKPFFVQVDGGYQIRFEWEGRTNPSYTAWPADGIWVRVRAKVELD